MATIVLNDTSFNLNSFGHNTVFGNETITSYAYFNMEYGNNYDTLYALAENPITSLSIKNSSDEVIYSLSDINALITNIDASLTGEFMTINVNLQFIN